MLQGKVEGHIIVPVVTLHLLMRTFGLEVYHLDRAPLQLYLRALDLTRKAHPRNDRSFLSRSISKSVAI